jgi:hypothetical protein
MTEESMGRRQLISDRDYLTDRLTEITLELKRLVSEGDRLRAELDALSESETERRDTIRRRRAYIGRHSDELKVERHKAIADRDEFIKQLWADTP